jgi:hypothetical protein
MPKITANPQAHGIALRTAKGVMLLMMDRWISTTDVLDANPIMHPSNAHRYLVALADEGFAVRRLRTRERSAELGLPHRVAYEYTTHKLWGGMAHDSE